MPPSASVSAAISAHATNLVRVSRRSSNRVLRNIRNQRNLRTQQQKQQQFGQEVLPPNYKIPRNGSNNHGVTSTTSTTTTTTSSPNLVQGLYSSRVVAAQPQPASLVMQQQPMQYNQSIHHDPKAYVVSSSISIDNSSGMNRLSSTSLRNGSGSKMTFSSLIASNNNNDSSMLDDDSSSDSSSMKKTFASDLVVVLDMDECLIHSQFLPNGSTFDGDVDEYRQYEAGRSTGASSSPSSGGIRIQDTTTSTNSSCEYFYIEIPDNGDLVKVNKRPFLQEFLTEITTKFETHVFTAAMEIYANPVLDVLDPMNNMLQQRFYRESCIVDEEMGVYVKDLEVILGDTDNGRYASSYPNQQKHINEDQQSSQSTTPLNKIFNERRVVLVDNNPLSFLANPSNGILVSNFYDDPNDETLPAVLDLLHQLDQEEDVRPTLDNMFGLKEALGEVHAAAGKKRRN